MPKTVIHIGANKTGSTTLQRCLFSKAEEVVYIGEDDKDYDTYKDILNSLISDDDIHFCHKKAEELFRNSRLSTGGKTFLFSSEDIMSSRVPSLCARRLYEFLPDAQILVIIRNQLTAIPSWYANHGAYLKMVPRRYWRKYVSFDDWMDYCTEFIKYSPLDSYFYHRILSLYATLFRKQNIHILFYEDFVNNNKNFIADLCKILEIGTEEAFKLLEGKRERRRNSMREFRYHRFCNYIGGKDLINYLPGEKLKRMCGNILAGGPTADGFMSDYWQDKIIELYEEDNFKLMEKYNIDLKKYGYPLPKDCK